MTKRILFTTLILSMATRQAGAQAPVRPVDQPRSVTMTLAEYNRLLDLAARAPAAPIAAPVAAVVSTADLKITVDRESARGVFSLAGQVLQNGISRVPLIAGTTLVDATAAGRPVPLVADGQTLNALIAGPAPFALTLEWGGPLVFRPGRGSFIVPVPQAGAARATIELPGEQADVRLSAGLITRRAVTNGRTIIEATLDPGASTEVWWSMRDSAPVAAAKDVRALAEIMTLITLDEADVRMVALIDVSVTQGELRTLTINVPNGYELQSVSGNTLEEFAPLEHEVVLTVGNPAARSHQFLVNLERSHQGGTFSFDTGLVSLKEVQRERGEIAIEGVGTMDLTAAEQPGVHRMDVRELNTSVQALARLPILSAFRYQRAIGSEPPAMQFGVKRFNDAGVLAAAADKATATTLITSEGRALTEVRLLMRNRSQPFLKVELPQGATIVSVDLAGRSAKPATGADGTRIPLMRSGLDSSRPYTVSFVYVHAGTPFLKKGDIDMALPKMDVPIGVVEWELFVPEQYNAKAIDGNMIDAKRFGGVSALTYYSHVNNAPARLVPAMGVMPGQIRGRVADRQLGALPGVAIRIAIGSYQAAAISDSNGDFTFSGVPAGEVVMTAELAGFARRETNFRFDGSPRRIELDMEVSSISETVTVTAEAALADVDKRSVQMEPPSQNVVNLQARAAGVLPIRVDVPRAGVSHQFIKPLVVGTEATVTLRYKRR
ncbi:MAG TPA: carboxypeptidase-like regulatory domain-containing protein [Vicinamibacterales bacterium]|nr:carboxypeptidase-like regulatory domain-containing protein [Vicinamibacterales bacterium]